MVEWIRNTVRRRSVRMVMKECLSLFPQVALRLWMLSVIGVQFGLTVINVAPKFSKI